MSTRPALTLTSYENSFPVGSTPAAPASHNLVALCETDGGGENGSAPATITMNSSTECTLKVARCPLQHLSSSLEKGLVQLDEEGSSHPSAENRPRAAIITAATSLPANSSDHRCGALSRDGHDDDSRKRDGDVAELLFDPCASRRTHSSASSVTALSDCYLSRKGNGGFTSGSAQTFLQSTESGGYNNREDSRRLLSGSDVGTPDGSVNDLSQHSRESNPSCATPAGGEGHDEDSASMSTSSIPLAMTGAVDVTATRSPLLQHRFSCSSSRRRVGSHPAFRRPSDNQGDLRRLSSGAALHSPHATPPSQPGTFATDTHRDHCASPHGDTSGPTDVRGTPSFSEQEPFTYGCGAMGCPALEDSDGCFSDEQGFGA